MKMTLIPKIAEPLPSELYKLVQNSRIFDSSCSPEARVYYIEKDGGYYLKRGELTSLRDEALMNSYFHKKGIGAEVLYYGALEYDCLLTRAVAGDDCTHEKYLSEPRRLAHLMGEELRRLHETDFSDCPVKDRMTAYVALAESNYNTGSYDKSHFPDSFGYRSPEEAFSVFSEGKGLLKNEVLLHGDFCLPNICLSDWSLSAYIDVGFGGVGDRHVDLFWGSWTLGFNLHTNEYADNFVDAYGKDKLNFDALKTVAAAEVFR